MKSDVLRTIKLCRFLFTDVSEDIYASFLWVKEVQRD